MAENSLLINEPIKLCEAALKNFNHNYEDPLTYTVKFWADILNCLDLGELIGVDTRPKKGTYRIFRVYFRYIIDGPLGGDLIRFGTI